MLPFERRVSWKILGVDGLKISLTYQLHLWKVAKSFTSYVIPANIRGPERSPPLGHVEHWCDGSVGIVGPF